MMDANGYGIGILAGLGLQQEGIYSDFFSLPEEIRAEIERHREEIQSPEDLHRIAEEARLRR